MRLIIFNLIIYNWTLKLRPNKLNMIFKINLYNNKYNFLYYFFKKIKLNIIIKNYFKLKKFKTKIKYYLSNILKIKLKKKYISRMLKSLKNVRKNFILNYNFYFKNSNKNNYYLNIIYFLKYYLLLKKKIFNSIKLSKIKIVNFKGYKKKNIKKLKYKLYNKNNKFNLNLFHFRLLNLKKLKKKFKQDKIYDIKKKYIRYFINNRLLYSLYNKKNKIKYKYFKTQFRYMSSINIKERLNFFELSLKNLIIKTKYSYSIKTSLFFIKSGFIFINGIQNLNSNYVLKKNDYIELIYSNILFKIKKKLKNKVFKNIWLYKKFIFKKYKVYEKEFNTKLKLFFISRLFLYFKNNMYSNFQFDFRTQSFIFIKEINIKKNISYINKKYLPIYYLKLLNWKIIS